MSTATLTSKGQTSIPKDIRRKLQLRPGTKLHFHLLPNGTISIRIKSGTALDLKGILQRSADQVVSVEEMSNAGPRSAVARYKRSSKK